MLALRSAADADEPPRPRPRIRLAVIFGLLVGSALSKEYGAAFALAVAVVALLKPPGQRRTLVMVAVAAVVIFVGARTAALGGFGVAHYCEDMGFKHRLLHVCYDDLSTRARLGQYGWNMAASLVGTFFPSLFAFGGQFIVFSLGSFGTLIPIGSLVVPAIVTLLALVALARRTRAALPLFAVIAGNAALNFVLYRDRNQLIGVLALYAAAGLGASVVVPHVLRRRGGRLALAVPLTALAIWRGLGGVDRAQYAAQFASNNLGMNNPCEEYSRHPPDIDLGTVLMLEREYRLGDPTCATTWHQLGFKPARDG